ncbi:aldo/keto reductase [Spongiactinospora sp. TRM90649]|uniref:aldo/keto reductase n=1 Tax=Spongiactinospora sp. TRM90649 TaxID=3031114 RepID=UPI0023F6EF91|nr:aldo/keto reductase [Spongiactinospora sp. TRM90649]MDF5758975.1 aldo/keto reductase [Spongiactinospora sp. TRM90649]
MTGVPHVTLNNGVTIPQLGLGVFQVPSETTSEVVVAALDAGYRSVDTAAAYGNEADVGRGLAASGVPREDVFVTTKLWNTDQGYDAALRAFDASVTALGLDVLDLYLIHWPAPGKDLYLDTWRALERLLGERRVRAIGVSNFQPAHLTRLIERSDTVPAVNQIELHPLLQQAGLRAFHAEHGIATEAWSPLAQGKVLKDPAVAAIAERHGKSPAQVVLRWHVQLGDIVIPKSVTPARIRGNIDVFDFELSAEDMAAITALETGKRLGPDPDAFG